jgi:hypothetical protein
MKSLLSHFYIIIIFIIKCTHTNTLNLVVIQHKCKFTLQTIKMANLHTVECSDSRSRTLQDQM